MRINNNNEDHSPKIPKKLNWDTYRFFIRKLAVICVHVLILRCNAWGVLGLQ